MNRGKHDPLCRYLHKHTTWDKSGELLVGQNWGTYLRDKLGKYLKNHRHCLLVVKTRLREVDLGSVTHSKLATSEYFFCKIFVCF